MDPEFAVLDRLAHGMADRIGEADGLDHTGRRRSNPAAGGTVEASLAEVLGRLQVSDRGCAELVR